jgi:sideroflexin-5
MRLNGFVVFNCPILLICLFTRNQTPVFNAGMQWVNQTYNAGMNYGNRNASSTYTTSDLMRGYSGAVVTSMAIALISRTMLAGRLNSLSGARLIMANATLNYFAAAFAGAGNLILMRFKEL